MGGFGCAAVPLVDGAEVGLGEDFAGGAEVEGGAGNCRSGLGVACVVGEVVVDEGGVVFAQAGDALLALTVCLAAAQGGGGLDVLAVLAP